ncbi:MAG: lytic murein transglycosylase [Hyphomicrobiales bacterium]|nr:lytic murein transglycosylase [Hyphomicrobiales bacterium]
MVFGKCIGAVTVVAGLIAVSPAHAAGCHKERDFNSWLKGVGNEAAAAGISQNAIQAGLGAARFDQSIVDKDRSQGVFAQTFLQFSDRMVEKYRVNQAPGQIRKHGKTFQRIEQQFGVPAEIIVAFWGLETDFGAVIGDGPTLTALATLAYDCRRPELFREQLIAALKIIDRGDLTPAQMRGPWAGEMGQLQFLPSHYYDYGVDFDGNGRVDLLKSSADALASAAKFLSALGWRRGEPWLQEVKVPKDFPWEMADLRFRFPRSEWVAAGVTGVGKKLPNDGLEAALVLPMGRNGPAFLAYPNFYILLEWNSSLVYATSAAYFATRIDGAPRVSRGGTINSLSAKEVARLQTILAKRGYDVGKVDGIIGEKTRAAVKEVQLKLGMPADSYPTKELLAKL